MGAAPQQKPRALGRIERRAYGDFRGFARWGGKREPLIAPGDTRATSDATVAAVQVAERLKELEALKRGEALGAKRPGATLERFASEHLIAKRQAGTSVKWLSQCEVYLQRAVEQFGANRQLDTIEVEDVEQWIEVLRSTGHGTRSR